MEPSRRSGMSDSGNAAATGSVNASPSVIGHLPIRSTAAISSNAKASGLCHGDNHRVPSQHCSNSSNVIQHHQYPPILGPPPLIRSSLVHPAAAGSLLPASSQLMLPTTPTSTSDVIPRYQQHGGNRSHQLADATTPPASVSPVVMPNSNINSTLGMVSPFGILPHERVIPHQTHHRHQNRKLSACPQSSKNLMDTSGTQLLASSVSNPQRFYDEPIAHTGSKMKQYESVQQSHHRIKGANGVADKGQPAVSSGYTPHSYEPRYQPRTVSQQVGYLSVITRAAVATVNGNVMDDGTSNNNYYQAPLQAKTSENHDRQYYHFDSSASQTPQQTVDNMLLMGTPVQRGDPMHIVKNLQSMQTDVDCYGVKKMIEQHPRILTMEDSKSVGPTALLNNNGKCSVENQHVTQLTKSTVTDPSLSYNSQYFNRRQPPPAHLHQHHNQSHIQQHLASGNGKMLPTPTSLTVVSANGSSYYDQRHHRWNLDHQKPLTPSCFSGNIPTGMFHQPSLSQQQYNNTVSTFNAQPPESSIHQHQQNMSESVHHNNFIIAPGNPTYYNLTTTMVSPTVTSVTTTSSSMTYNRHNPNNQNNPNNFQNFANNAQSGNFPVNNDNRFLPHGIVPNIEQELGHLCDDTLSAASVIVKPSNVVTKKPSFIDCYIKFLNGDRNSSTVKTEDECFEKPKKLQKLLVSSPPKLISKPYIPLSKPKAPISISETPLPKNESCESSKNIVTTTDDDPRYFPLPKTSASTTIDSDESNSDSNWLSSADDDHDASWWTTPSKTPSTSTTPVIKSKLDVKKKKKKKYAVVKKKQSNTVSTTKKQKTNNEQQPKRQLSHRLAKEKTQKMLTTLESNAEDEDGLSDANSDVDPAWVPKNDDNDTSKNTSLSSNRRNFSHKKFSKEQCRSGSSLTNNNNQTDDLTVTMPFKSGSFVALKSQFMGKNNKNPQLLWRVDGKSLLQKFQRINGNTFRSATTYTGWGPSHYSMYRQVAIKFVNLPNDIPNVLHKSPSTDILVKLISDGNNSDDNTKVSLTDCDNTSQLKVDSFDSNSHVPIEDSIKNLRKNFDVYVQTLLSQALDSKFLEEIYRVNDNFFVSNIKTIETVTQSTIEAMDSIITQDSVIELSSIENVCKLVTKYPDIEMLELDESSVRNIQLLCVVCGRRGFIGKHQKFIVISFSGLEYNPRSLTNVDTNEVISKSMPTKRAHCCSSTECTNKLMILHSLKHLKYDIYKECCKRINAENDGCYQLTKETAPVLNRLLADEEWIKKLFDKACNTWARAKMFISNKQSNC